MIDCLTETGTLTAFKSNMSSTHYENIQKKFCEFDLPMIRDLDSIIWVVVVASNRFHFVLSQNSEISKLYQLTGAIKLVD